MDLVTGGKLVIALPLIDNSGNLMKTGSWRPLSKVANITLGLVFSFLPFLVFSYSAIPRNWFLWRNNSAVELIPRRNGSLTWN